MASSRPRPVTPTGPNIQTALNDPGKPWQNGTDEIFNERLRDECLNQEWFRSRHADRVLIEKWRRHYREVRPQVTPGTKNPGQVRAMVAFERGIYQPPSTFPGTDS